MQFHEKMAAMMKAMVKPTTKPKRGPEYGSTRVGCTSVRAMKRNIRRTRAGR